MSKPLRYAAAVMAIPQRTLRNRSGQTLQEAEAGERFVITVTRDPRDFEPPAGPVDLRRA